MTAASKPTVTDWKPDRLDDLTDKRFLITGANSGIGFEAAAHLRRANADIFIASRSVEKAKAAVADLSSIKSAGTLTVVPLDLADLSSIENANETIREHTDGLDAIINNAGIMQTPQLETTDGFELQFGTNHLGHFRLNYLLFDLVSARSGRIVPVSSFVHHQAEGIDFDDPMLANSYSPSKAYAQSKLANLMYGQELARRLEAAGSAVASISAHPGYSATNLMSTGPTGLFRFIYKFSNALAQKADDGAIPEVLAAAGNEAVNGGYYGPTKRRDTRGPVGDSRISAAAKNEAAGARLWSLSEDLLDMTWHVSVGPTDS